MLYHAMKYLKSVPGSASHNFLQVPLRPPMVFLFDPTLCEQVTLWLKSFSSTDCIVYISPTKIFATRFIAQLALNLSDQVLTRSALSRYVKVHQPIFHPTPKSSPIISIFRRKCEAGTVTVVCSSLRRRSGASFDQR